MSAYAENMIALPSPRVESSHSVESLLQQRRSIRAYRDVGVTLAEVGQLLWAAQGITHPEGFRTAPSAGALYPLELYVLAGKVKGLSVGVYHYLAKSHRLQLIASRDVRKALAKAALSQEWVASAPVVIVFVAIPERTTGKYGKRGIRYVHMEVGFAAENLFLQAEALNLGTVVVGAFQDKAVSEILGLPSDQEPMILMPVGRK